MIFFFFSFLDNLFVLLDLFFVLCSWVIIYRGRGSFSEVDFTWGLNGEGGCFWCIYLCLET